MSMGMAFRHQAFDRSLETAMTKEHRTVKRPRRLWRVIAFAIAFVAVVIWLGFSAHTLLERSGTDLEHEFSDVEPKIEP